MRCDPHLPETAKANGLVETAKANSLEPYRYLRHVFIRLPAANTIEAFEALLSTRVAPATINPLLL